MIELAQDDSEDIESKDHYSVNWDATNKMWNVSNFNNVIFSLWKRGFAECELANNLNEVITKWQDYQPSDRKIIKS